MSTQENGVIQIENVSFRYGTQNVLEKVNLTIEQGSFLGLAGPNGSGKSTLIKIILGFETPDMGRVTLFHVPVSKFKNWEKIGYVSQKANSFNTGFPATVYEVVSMGLYGKIGLFRFLNKKHKKKIDETLQLVGMREFKHRSIGELSGGQQQRVFIARALVSEPEVLILDEPTVGVDTQSVQQFYHLMSHLNREKKITLLLVTHDIGAMTKYVTHVACLNKRLHFHGSSHDFEESELSSLYGHDVTMITHEHDHGGA
ncbi:metal ABC transporter ATP-binding protein [Alteribacillus iranensis]|uniref:Zinc transport system ATP-binding protein n=1 Tax=Alteribacillus iranensis TaxID=930128 RepID=A0A1I1ZCI7_9BACI|nr:metal ABC transporter ATP-binding protein [Alteribacillus iranensis]SFE29471.1 zinc transport system ATP-binding protein [Alteribacillus iranensis]